MTETAIQQKPEPKRLLREGFWRSKGARLLLVFLLTVLMTVPLMMLGSITAERENYSDRATREIGSTWGGPQVLIGPLITVPVESETVQVDGEGNEMTVRSARTIVVAPQSLNASISAGTETRYRGIFNATVYDARAVFEGEFGKLEIETALRPGETALWDRAELSVHVSDTRGFRNNVVLDWDGDKLDFEPAGSASAGAIGWAGPRPTRRMEEALPIAAAGSSTGLKARIGDPREAMGRFAFALDLRGSEQLFIAPVGRDTSVTMDADWPHPSFKGAFLPLSHEISDTGFTAEWSVPYLARGFPQVWSAPVEPAIAAPATRAAFGVLFYQPVNFYQKVERALKYALLFIGLTFVTIFLLEGVTRSRVHAVQYLLVGLAECVFFLLLLAFAEHIGFALAYLLAAVATIALLTIYAATALRAGRTTWIVTASLVTLYAFLYLLLESRDYALLIGSIAAFLCLAATMLATRKVDWWADED